MLGETEIPSELVNEGTTADPNGPCSLCRVHSLGAAQGSSGEAELDLYFEDDGQDLVGHLRLEVELDTQEVIVIIVDDVTIDDGEIGSFVLEPGVEWSWEDVVYVWVEPLPGSPGN
ncbi:MAG: hypothetical protein H6712_00335 [Myxococcales bacterium]|nr:hypothetical protein [Myxococcales bacterium]MCB9712272.1 hypothetical protein [Myxococcales bacterium]